MFGAVRSMIARIGIQPLAKSASAFLLKKIVGTDHLGHFCLYSAVL